MIRVDRNSVIAPSVLVAENSLGKREAALNEARARTGRFDEMTYTAYKKDGVGEALDELFNRKCAYCESLLAGQQPGDIEHYRPKAKVVYIDQHGIKHIVPNVYYWLAADWENLLLSCADCNRPRSQDLTDASERVIGKGNLFPLDDESKRASAAHQVSNEPCLLLNPCSDDPNLHLVFKLDCTIEPRLIDGGFSRTGESTIQTCGLQRIELLQARASYMRGVHSAARCVAKAIADGIEPDARDIDDITYYMSPKSPYSAFAREVIRYHLAPKLAEVRI